MGAAARMANVQPEPALRRAEPVAPPPHGTSGTASTDSRCPPGRPSVKRTVGTTYVESPWPHRCPRLASAEPLP